MGIIRIIINDFKTDYEFIKNYVQNPDYRKKVVYTIRNLIHYIQNHFLEIIKEYWIWYLIIIFAFVAGWAMASAYNSAQCQQWCATELKRMATHFGVENLIW